MTRRIEVAPEDWDCVRLLSDETPEGRIEVGPTEDLIAPIGVINMVSQVRQEYDPEDMEELKNAMIVQDEAGEQQIKLIQPITVGYFHRTDLKKYLAKLNDTWGTTHQVEELEPVPGSHGRYYFLVVAGHRRTLAIEKAAEDIGIDLDRIDVVFHVLQGSDFTFREGIKTQYRENFHKRPESWEDAIAINAILGEGLRSGEYHTFVDCAKDLGINPDRVSKAFRFNELPEIIRNMVENKTLSYGAATAIYDLAVAMAFRDGKERYGEEELARFYWQFDNGRAMLSDALSYLTDSEVDRWERELVFTHIESDEIRGKTVAGVEKEVAKLSAEFLKGRGETQLTLTPLSESDLRRQAERSEAARARGILNGAIKNIVHILDAELTRIRNGRDPVMAKGWSPVLLANTRRALIGVSSLSDELYGVSIDELEEKLKVAAEAGRAVVDELTYYDTSERDVFVDATNAVGFFDSE